MYQPFWKMLVASPSAISTATEMPPRPSTYRNRNAFSHAP